jgi:hypothetical protein
LDDAVEKEKNEVKEIYGEVSTVISVSTVYVYNGKYVLYFM